MHFQLYDESLSISTVRITTQFGWCSTLRDDIMVENLKTEKHSRHEMGDDEKSEKIHTVRVQID